MSSEIDSRGSFRSKKQANRNVMKKKVVKRENSVDDSDLDGLFKSLREKSIEELKNELILAQNDQHHILIKSKEDFKLKTAEAIERIDVAEKMTLKKITEEYEAREKKITENTQRKLSEMKAEMEKDLEALEKRTELEYSSLEINKPTTSNIIDINKKILRGRGGILIEPPTYFNATPKTTVVSVHSNAKFLLAEHDIMEDLKLISSASNTPQKSRRQFDVQLQKLRFTYDGRSYKQGEEVYVENSEYGRIPMKAENITENVVSFRATQSWDIRQIHASHSDLAEGRVIVSKKK
ncbi:unnamed protein product [Caenorhabditis angaria]|uniref:Uncharacterized protein n=1 Tax=Caenorhabditis angaria TaxID=860376 RepID=A0A9P1II23_9PELO|nr:unnamed protein product [Caenorhabditis angaria]